MHVLVNSGADSVSHSVRPNQNVGRSWKFQRAAGAVVVGLLLGFLGSVSSYVMSLPEPGTADLKSTDGSS